MLWMSEPDATQHSRGVGSAPDLEAIRGLDRNLALLLRELERRGVRAKTDVIIVSDHGFSTVAEIIDTAGALRRAGLSARRQFQGPAADGDIMVVGNGGAVLIYVIGHKAEVVQKAVAVLQRESFIGTIFTRDGLPGTFPLREARLDSAHAPDIVVSMGWQGGGYTNRLPGLIFEDGTGRGSQHGMHATLAPTDMQNTCVASGPDFRAGMTNAVASGNVDLTPTLLWLLDIKPPKPTDGRVLFETLAKADTQPQRIESRKLQTRADLPGGTWTQYLSFTEVNGVRYLDEGNGQFTPQATTNAPPVRTGNP
jgi:arylsulfatase A-like enzyme